MSNTKETFSTLRVKIQTAKKFRHFSKRFFKTHTETLKTMLDFFFYNEISPKEIFGPTGRTLENLIKKRFNGMAAIMKEMDKHGRHKRSNLLYFGNFNDLDENEYIDNLTNLIYQGDKLYKTIAMDTYYLGKSIGKKHGYLRKSLDVFLTGLILSVLGFIICHLFFVEIF